MTACRACFSANTSPVPFELPDDEPPFVRCLECGSDSSPYNYDDYKHNYNTENAIGHERNGGGNAAMRLSCSGNCDWFTRDPFQHIPRTFLDVGSCDGSALDNMTALGWDCEGFDVLTPPDGRHRVTIADEFRADLFGRQFGAVMSREVIEHVPDPHEHLRQLVAACLDGGQVQIQTPAPLDHFHGMQYQTLHLCIFSPSRIQEMIAGVGLRIFDRMIWEGGQAYLCRKPITGS